MTGAPPAPSRSGTPSPSASPTTTFSPSAPASARASPWRAASTPRGAPRRRARLGPLLGAVLLATLTFPCRVVRWRHLRPRDDGRAPGALPLWHAVAIGFTANNVLPFRAGELVRVAVASRLGGVRLTAAAAS